MTVTPGTPSAPEGEYKLVVGVWKELVSKAGEARQFVRHVYGDIVQLDAEHADRLLKAGAVEPLTNEAKAVAKANGPTDVDKAKATAAAKGPQPLTT